MKCGDGLGMRLCRTGIGIGHIAEVCRPSDTCLRFVGWADECFEVTACQLAHPNPHQSFTSFHPSPMGGQPTHQSHLLILQLLSEDFH